MDDSWQVRVCDDRGKTVGAGVLLGRDRVPTCAHVVRTASLTAAGPGGPGSPLRIESVLCHPRWSTSASVIPGCSISDRGTLRGDVVLLELHTAVTCHQGARLRQAPIRGAAVRVSGFPDGGRVGVIAAATVVGVSYEGEWMEMHAASQDRGQWITQGYSGAGVADEASGDVVGIVVAVREAGSSVNAWMMPVETIRGYLAPVDAYVVGGETTDPAPAGKSSVLVGANAWARPMLCAMAASGGSCVGERCGMVIDCAAATGLSRCDERIRAAAAATDEKRGQRRGDPRAAPPALGLAAAAWSGQGAVHPG